MFIHSLLCDPRCIKQTLIIVIYTAGQREHHLLSGLAVVSSWFIINGRAGEFFWAKTACVKKCFPTLKPKQKGAGLIAMRRGA